MKRSQLSSKLTPKIPSSRSSQPPLLDRYLSLKPQPIKDLPLDNPCLNIDPRDPEAWQRAMDCPSLDIPVRLPPRPPAQKAIPDLVFAVYQAYASPDGGIAHVGTIRNIGTGSITSDLEDHSQKIGLNFYVSNNPMLDLQDPQSFEGAGGWGLGPDGPLLPGQMKITLAPGEEQDFYFTAGSLMDYTPYNYSIAMLKIYPGHRHYSSEPDLNNLSVAPILIEI